MSSSSRPKGKQPAATKIPSKRIRTIDDIANMNEARKRQELQDLEEEAAKLLNTQSAEASTTMSEPVTEPEVAPQPVVEQAPPRAVTPGTTLGDLAAQAASTTRPVAPQPVRPMRMPDLTADPVVDALPTAPVLAPLRPRSGSGMGATTASMPTKPPTAPQRSKQDVIDATAGEEKARIRFFAIESIGAYKARYAAECGKHIPDNYHTLPLERLVEIRKTCQLATESCNERTAICYGISAIGHAFEVMSPTMPAPYCNSENVARTLETLVADHTTPLGRAADLLALMYMGSIPGNHPLIQIALGVALGIKTVCNENTQRLAQQQLQQQSRDTSDVAPPVMNGL